MNILKDTFAYKQNTFLCIHTDIHKCILLFIHLLVDILDEIINVHAAEAHRQLEKEPSWSNLQGNELIN